MILSLPWITKQDARINGRTSECKIMSTDTLVRNQAASLEPGTNNDAARPLGETNCLPISINAFRTMTKHAAQRKIQVFLASLRDIAKALDKMKKAKIDPRTKLPSQYWKYLDAFSPTDSDKIPPLRGGDIDHKIDLVIENGKELVVP